MATDKERNQGAGAYSTDGVDQKPETGPSQIITQNPVVQFKLSQVEPPSPLYLSQSEKLFLSATNTDPNVVQIFLSGRQLRASDGQITPFILTMPINSSRVTVRQSFDMTEGYLLGIEVSGGGGAKTGRCYVSVDVSRGAGVTTPPVTLYQELISDYISIGHNATWPNGQYVHSTQNPGAARVITGTTPGAGVEISETVPTAARWRLKSFRFRLVTSVAAGNRSVRLIWTQGGVQNFIVSFNFPQPPSTTQDYELGIGLSFLNDATQNVSIGGLSENLLFQGSAITSLTNNLAAGDQYSLVGYQVEEWIEI